MQSRGVEHVRCAVLKPQSLGLKSIGPNLPEAALASNLQTAKPSNCSRLVSEIAFPAHNIAARWRPVPLVLLQSLRSLHSKAVFQSLVLRIFDSMDYMHERSTESTEETIAFRQWPGGNCHFRMHRYCGPTFLSPRDRSPSSQYSEEQSETTWPGTAQLSQDLPGSNAGSAWRSAVSNESQRAVKPVSRRQTPPIHPRL